MIEGKTVQKERLYNNAIMIPAISQILDLWAILSRQGIEKSATI